MKAGVFSIVLFSIFLLLFSSCSKVEKDDGSWVTSAIQERIQKQVKWYQTKEEELVMQEKVASLLEKEIRVEEAVQVALLNNPSLQATFEEIGVAHADLVEAGLYQNPIFDGYFRFPLAKVFVSPTKKKFVLNPLLQLSGNFLDLFLVPLRKKTAGLEFEKTKLQVANKIFNLSAEVEQTFYALQAAMNKWSLQKILVESNLASGGVAKTQLEAGNIYKLDLENRIVDLQQAKLEVKQTEIEIISLRKKLSILMGVKDDHWTVDSSLPSFPEQEIPLEDLEALALQERFDVAAAKKEVEAIASIGAQKKWWAYTNGQIGISSEFEPENVWYIGPLWNLSLPIFNFGQADRARLYAELRRSQDQFFALEIEVKAQVRAAQENLIRIRQIVEYYQKSILPLRDKIMDSSVRLFNAMSYGVYDLLYNQQEKIHSQINYEIALRDYWVARSMLDLAVGRKLQYELKE